MARDGQGGDGSELGRFLRARRARVTPQEAGVPIGPGLRRTPGLRRAEPATLAGVGIDHYTRLERGGETSPEVGDVPPGHQSMQIEGTPGRRFIAYFAEPGSDDHDRLVLLDMAVARTSPTAP
jgi:hypothetical protein